MVAPFAREAGMAHVTFAWPSISARQAPHCPCGEQPSFTEMIPHCSRSTSSREASSRTVSWRGVPFNVKERSITARIHLGREGSPASSV
jgi:hypothetical protein